MEEIAEAGHWVHAEDPKRTLALIKLIVNGEL
jgi:pimeloyl-ACP methyl ester carboxylesterase